MGLLVESLRMEGNSLAGKCSTFQSTSYSLGEKGDIVDKEAEILYDNLTKQE